MSKPKQKDELETEATTQEQDNLEVVEVSWEETKDTFELRREFMKTQQYLSDFLLTNERKKSALLERLGGLEAAMYDSATELQERHSLNPEWTYEFKLPTIEGEKAYFIRKEE